MVGTQQPLAVSEVALKQADRLALVDAIVTIRTAMTHAAAGDDPWVLSAGTVDISFDVTKAGSISVGAEGDLASEVTHVLRLRLTPYLATAN